MTISTVLAQKFCEALEALAMDSDIEIHSDYSGRGMFGKTCLGITTDCSDFFVAFTLTSAIHDMKDITEDDRELLLEQLKHTLKDNMGMDYIYYWRGISLQP